ncbi:hypothetical protein [Halomarina litorea]|uniref:hypothetical protein n=1 Tax=Halomarina litorea TaxID=2961595 RepID=UPI0020C38A0B|nr:hypothetical protein [Halomarina sp. BCD28]
MKEIAVTDEQYAYIDGLREALKTERVGRYGHVRMQDALQYLVDTHAPVADDGEDPPVGRIDADPERDALDAADPEVAGGSGASSEADGEDEGDESGEVDETKDGEDGDADDDGREGEDADDESEDGEGDDGDRLSAMMNLLDTHTEKWGETPSEQGRYEVKLPDGELEVVQTKDDVRAVLFKNYR